MQRRTFAIISHPDAGKTTITEKLLLFAGAIEVAGSVKGKKNTRKARSDWMEMEKERGISVSSSVMQFSYQDCIFNLLDTPGHEDFSEDTYRVLTAVDCALMIIDGVKGVESRTRKLMSICRQRSIPVITFVNKFDRSARCPMSLLEQIEQELHLECKPQTWPIGSGKDFKGVYSFEHQHCSLYQTGQNYLAQKPELSSLDTTLEHLTDQFLATDLKEQIELYSEVSTLEKEKFHSGDQSPVYFGSALNNFGINEVLDSFAQYAPNPQSRLLDDGTQISPQGEDFSAFVFKVQANMNPGHRDRVAFCRICSGSYTQGQKLFHVSSGKFMQNTQAVGFLGQDRQRVEQAQPGDIIGLVNHGSISIGDTFSSKKVKKMKFQGISKFAPEIFQQVQLKDPLKSKQLQMGLTQLSQEGATQFFKMIHGNTLILGAVGVLQFDVAQHRLKTEYNLNCQFTPSTYVCATWVSSGSESERLKLEQDYGHQLAYDSAGDLVLLGTSLIQLQIIQDKFSTCTFSSIKDF